MQTTLRIDSATYREAKAEAARCGVTLTQFLEEALKLKIAISRGDGPERPELRKEVEQRDRLMEALLERTAHFRVGPHPTREELNAR
ncbi:MAG: hypothetical protein JXP34_19000 [Planctomycetes bacterium]|nr:hypothetical protein [Planctomycetota bacterium]